MSNGRTIDAPSPRVSFNRHRAEIERLLKEGHTRKSVYAGLGRELGMGYANFCLYVKALVDYDRQPAISPRAKRAKPAAQAGTAIGASPPPSSSQETRETSNAERRREPPAAGSFVAGHKDFADEEDIARLNRRAKPKAPNS